MEYNREESIKCLKIAAECLSRGDKDKALKFAQKSERLYPSAPAKDLLEKINRLGGPPTDNASRCMNSKSTQADNKSNYTQEQVNSVNRIKSCKDYYEILDVNHDASENEIKKRYRKLAFQFHPDKNHAPGAVEAFKAIGNAFSVLSDAEKRRRYDLASPGHNSSAHHQHNSQQKWDYTHGFESDMNADEIFNQFFRGSEFANGHGAKGYSNGGTAHTFRRHHHVNDQDRSQLLLQLSPIFLLVVLSMASFAFVEEQKYSFTQTSRYSEKLVSETLHVTYFVVADFINKYTQDTAHRIDMEVETVYVTNLKKGCRKETIQKESLLSMGGINGVHRAEQLEMSQCKELERLQNDYT